MNFQISDKVSWIGKIDWELRKFHGDQLTTRFGSSYNAFLIKDKKNVVIDSVHGPFTNEFIENIKSEIELDQIDYVIVNHAEPDHSAGIPVLMELIPDVPIICTANGAKILKGMYHKDWNFQIVKTGDTLDIGENELMFIEAPMLHWPDTMITYMKGENILFSSDIFGQHYASEKMYSDLVNKADLIDEAIIYYANIVSPYSKIALKKIKELKALNLPISCICPAHGMMWRDDNIPEIIDLYEQWADSYQENKITIFYDSMYGNTRQMAEMIGRGIANQDKDVTVRILKASNTPSSEVVAHVFTSKAILVGSSTVNNGILNSVAAVTEELSTLNFKNKKAAVFGSYGWAPGSFKHLQKMLETSGFDIVNTGIKVQWTPTKEAIDDCVKYGKEFAIACQA